MQERVMVLRRAVRFGGGRFIDLARIEAAGVLQVAPSCHKLLPENRHIAWRAKGPSIDFWANAARPLQSTVS